MPIDVWTLRCIYNHSDYVHQIATGVLVPLLRETFSVQPDGSSTVQVYYGTETPRFALVRLQWFEGRNGEILRSGRKDPKEMYAEVGQRRVSFHIHKGDTPWQRVRKEPERLFQGNVRLQEWYGCWRTLKCSVFGPIEAYRMVWWRASALRSWLAWALSGYAWLENRPRRILRWFRIWRRSGRGIDRS